MFQACGDHRDLHSFPTRRSSDLLRPMSALPFKTGEIRRAYREIQWRHSGRAATLSASRKRGQRRDRKSTRLNSSHVEISYAVFCLKKKMNHVNVRSNVNLICDAT